MDPDPDLNYIDQNAGSRSTFNEFGSTTLFLTDSGKKVGTGTGSAKLITGTTSHYASVQRSKTRLQRLKGTVSQDF